MKIRSLLLGSVAAAGLSTGAFAADAPGIFAAFNVCDDLGISGLVIASETNCLKISGGVSYELVWGDYRDELVLFYPDGDAVSVPLANHGYDWSSKISSWLKFEAFANTDFGVAKAVIKLKSERAKQVQDANSPNEDDWVDGSNDVEVDEAYVAIGDSTVIMAGKKGSIMNKDGGPLNYLGLFGGGAGWSVDLPDGGHVIQVTSDLGNGLSVAAGLENLDGSDPSLAGTAVGVIAYSGDGIAAHVTLAAAGILDGTVENWGIHAGFSGTFDAVKFVAAFAADSDQYWNGIASASVGIDMFTLAGSVEASAVAAGSGFAGDQDVGAGGSISAGIADGITLNLGARWYQARINDNADAVQVEAQIVAAVTETLTLTGAIGAYNVVGLGGMSGDSQVYYGAAELAWSPGGGFTSSIKGEMFGGDADGYKVTSTFGKTFD